MFLGVTGTSDMYNITNSRIILCINGLRNEAETYCEPSGTSPDAVTSSTENRSFIGMTAANKAINLVSATFYIMPWADSIRVSRCAGRDHRWKKGFGCHTWNRRMLQITLQVSFEFIRMKWGSTRWTAINRTLPRHFAGLYYA